MDAVMPEVAEKILTQIAVPADLKRRIAEQALSDLRPYRSELVVLLEEAVSARERKGRR